MVLIKDILERIRRRINDSQSVEFSNDELLSYIHEGLSSLEMILLSSRVVFNLTSVTLSSSSEQLPDDLLEIYRVTFLGEEVGLSNGINKEDDKYFIYENSINVPYVPCELYYIKSFERPEVDGSLNIYRGYVEYIYRYGVIKALTRLEFNMDKEESELSQLTSLLIKNTIHSNGTVYMRRFGDYVL